MRRSPRPSVAFVIRHVHHYREGFYRGLRDELDRRGIDFELVHGDPSQREISKNDSVRPDWASFQPNRFFGIGANEVLYQPVLRRALRYDLVLVEQASRLLLNYALQARHLVPGGPRLGLVGHGANLAVSPHPVGEQLKRMTLKRSDWFFGYTEGTRRRLVDAGYPPDRITVFQNTIDTTELHRQLESVTDDDIDDFRSTLSVTGRQVVLVLGSLYPDKRPDLIEPVLDEVSRHRDDVHFVVVGSGPSAELLQSSDRADLSLAGPLFGRAKAVALRAADVLLVPGVAGLIVLDSFVAGVPIVTAQNDHHPPEVDYLVSGQNCVITETNTASDLGSAVLRLLDDPPTRQRLASAAVASGRPLTVDNMIQRFCDGVEVALDERKRPDFKGKG